jgi:hypothetical protein
MPIPFVRSTLLFVLALASASVAQAQSCTAEAHALAELHQRMRADVMSHQAAAAAVVWSQHQLETPVGYSFENNVPCQTWAREVAYDALHGCALERAQDQLEDMQRRQAVTGPEGDASPGAREQGIDVRAALAQLARRSSVRFSCPGTDNLYLLCRPKSEAVPDAWCARRLEEDNTLELPADATCKVVDGDGADVMDVVTGPGLSCAAAPKSYPDSNKQRMRAERRASVAAMGTFVSLMAATAVPTTFVPLGLASFLRRIDVLDEGRFEQLRHRSYRARVRYLPLIGMTALSVSSLSSRFWWAGVLTAGCGISADVLLADYWRNGGSSKRTIGIATASVASLAGLLLDIETLAYSDVGTSHVALVPTLHVGTAQLELGLGGRF